MKNPKSAIVGAVLLFLLCILFSEGCLLPDSPSLLSPEKPPSSEAITIVPPPPAESRNDFTRKIAGTPLKTDWTGQILFLKVLQLLEQPEMNIPLLFEETICRYSQDSYYVGAYTLADHLHCELLWITTDTHISTGFILSGPLDDIQKVEKFIQEKLNQPSRQDFQQNSYKKGWYDQTYQDVKYDMEYTVVLHDGMATLTMNIHPYVYH